MRRGGPGIRGAVPGPPHHRLRDVRCGLVQRCASLPCEEGRALKFSLALIAGSLGSLFFLYGVFDDPMWQFQRMLQLFADGRTW